MSLLSQILLGLSLITSGSALVCYHCLPNKRDTSVNTTSAGPTRSTSYLVTGYEVATRSPSCSPEPKTCASANDTYCMSIRRRKPLRAEQTYKTCASKDICLGAHHACVKMKNTSNSSKPYGECEALCCEGNLCNLHHSNAVLTDTVSSHLSLFFVTMVTSFVYLISVV